MRLTIIADGQVVSKDEVSYSGVDIAQLASNIHAVQWYETWGEIEYKPLIENGQITVPQNMIIESIGDYQWAVDAWQVAHDADIAAQAAAAEAEAEEAALVEAIAEQDAAELGE